MARALGTLQPIRVVEVALRVSHYIWVDYDYHLLNESPPFTLLQVTEQHALGQQKPLVKSTEGKISLKLIVLKMIHLQ